MPAGFNHPKTCTHVRLLGPCFKTGRMKPYDRQQPWHSLCILPSNSRPQFKRTARSPLWSTTDWERRSQPERAFAATPLSDPSSHTTSYNTGPKASYLLAGLFARFQHLLTHAVGKCDSRRPVTSTSGPFRSAKRRYQPPSA